MREAHIVSFFSEQLRIALDTTGLSQVQFAAQTGLRQSTLSRYLSGDNKPEVDPFGTILDNLPNTLHYDLILARIADEMPKRYLDTINILGRTHGYIIEESPPGAPTAIANDLANAIDYLRAEAVRDPTTRQLVLMLAKALGLDPK